MSKNKHAAALGKLGGKARAQALSKERRSEIARQGGLASAKNRVLRKEQADVMRNVREGPKSPNLMQIS